MNIQRKISRILFTFSWGGYSLEFSDGSRDQLSPNQLLELVGETEYKRLNKIAHRLTGHWHNAN